MRYWLLKSEPDDLSIDDLASAPGADVPWTGVRNFQARNFIRDQMARGDLAFFYHSSCTDIGIAGIVEVVSCAYPDPTQFDRDSKYFDAKSSRENPRWFSFDVRFVQRGAFVALSRLRQYPELDGMQLLARGNRLSITPVDNKAWMFIRRIMQA